MSKTRLLLAGSILPVLWLGQALAGSGFVVAQQQAAPDGEQKGRQAPKKDQAPGKQERSQGQQPPAAKGSPGGQTGQEQRQRGQPPAGQTGQEQRQRGQPPAAQSGQEQRQRGQPPAAQSGQEQRQKGQPPAAQTGQDQRQKGQPPAAQTGQEQRQRGQPPAAQSGQEQRQRGQPPAAQTGQEQRQKGQPPAGQTGQDQRQKGQPPAGQTGQDQRQRGQPPAGQTGQEQRQPGQPPASQTGQDQRQRGQPPAGQTGQEQRQPGQPPAGQTGQDQRQRGQPPAGQTGEDQRQRGQPPAAQTPGQTPPAAQGQTPGQPPAAAGQTPFQKRQPGSAIAVQPTGSQGQPIRRVEDLRRERREERQGDQMVIREGDRTIIRFGDRAIIRHNEAERFRYGGREVGVDRRGGEIRTVVERPDGTRIITVTDENGRLLRRTRQTRDGREIIIIDNRIVERPGARADFFVELPPPVIRIPRERYIVEADRASREDIYATLVAPPVDRIERRYSLEEVRYSPGLRQRMPRIDLDTITFESGSWEIAPDQVDALAVIAEGINRAIQRNPSEVFMIEGHTDAVGADVDNLSLSDRRAESVAVALSEQFQVPPENLTTQGYGEQQPKVPTQGPERQNRRVTVLRITPLLTGQGGPPGN